MRNDSVVASPRSICGPSSKAVARAEIVRRSTRTGRSHGFDRRQRGAESDRPERRGVGHVRPKWPEIEARRHDWAEIRIGAAAARKEIAQGLEEVAHEGAFAAQVVIRLGDPDRARVCGTKAREEHRRANVLKRRQHVRMVGFVEDEDPAHRTVRLAHHRKLRCAVRSDVDFHRRAANAHRADGCVDGEVAGLRSPPRHEADSALEDAEKSVVGACSAGSVEHVVDDDAGARRKTEHGAVRKADREGGAGSGLEHVAPVDRVP